MESKAYYALPHTTTERRVQERRVDIANTAAQAKSDAFNRYIKDLEDDIIVGETAKYKWMLVSIGFAAVSVMLGIKLYFPI